VRPFTLGTPHPPLLDIVLADQTFLAPPAAAGTAAITQGSLFGEADALGYDLGAVYDEMVTGNGRLRGHWQTFMSTLGPLDPDVMGVKWEEARRLLHQNGVTYNIYGDPQGMERPWPLDMIPLLIPPGDWESLTAGLAQRARLLNAVLNDVYGPQTLVRQGLIPPAALYADPGFRRVIHGIPVPGGIRLHFYAADLARSPDGRWVVLSDRTQAPSGGGYALENRSVITRIHTDALRHCGVEPLPPFFAAFREMLAGLAAWSSHPRVVLLTPGPYNETYFEHVYLARHLGITLVEGADLTVRDRHVFVKTLSGLEPVDVILRRLDADFADPLAFRADSSLGVAGLVEAVRAGHVVVANALGSGLVESLSFTSLLPSLCRRMLGEDLALAQLPSLWLGPGFDRAALARRLDRLVMAPAVASAPGPLASGPLASGRPVFGGDLDAAGREALLDRIAARPWSTVVQEKPTLSTAPVWDGGRLQARPLMLRVFLRATPDGGYAAMPGGLTRVSPDTGRLVISMQQGSGSKDTWVLSRERPGTLGLPSRPHHADHRPPEARVILGDLPSRVADSLFWLGRYAERSEAAVRLLRAAYTRLVDGNQPGAPTERGVVLWLMAWLGMVPWDLATVGETGSSRALRSALFAAVFDVNHPNSLRGNVQRMHRTAYTVRDRLSIDLWRVLSQTVRQSQQPTGTNARPDAAALLLHLDDVMIGLAAQAGLEQESMTRGPGWRFLDMGRRIERAIHALSLMRAARIADTATMTEPEVMARLEVLLELGESFMTYRARYLAEPFTAPVLDLLLLDETNPRALAFQLSALQNHLSHLPQTPETGVETAANIVAGARLALANPALLASPEALRGTLDTLAESLPEISNLVAHAYFSHAFARTA